MAPRLLASRPSLVLLALLVAVQPGFAGALGAQTEAQLRAEAQLLEAVKAGDQATVSARIAEGADVNASEADGTTPLHWAAYNSDVAITELLLGAGASARAANRYGVQPLSLAAVGGNAAIIELLLAAGADPNTQQGEGETALMTAARTGKLEAVESCSSTGPM